MFRRKRWPGGQKVVKPRRRKLLKIAVKHRSVGLALSALGFGRHVRTIKRLYQPKLFSTGRNKKRGR